MSAIFGVFRLDGKPVSQEVLGDMKDAMDYWGPDGSGIWCEGNVGLGHLMLHNTPESLNEKLPMKQKDKQLGADRFKFRHGLVIDFSQNTIWTILILLPCQHILWQLQIGQLS